jgi:hypothetical protein
VGRTRARKLPHFPFLVQVLIVSLGREEFEEEEFQIQQETTGWEETKESRI